MTDLVIRDHQHLCDLIEQWNENRLDLFSLTMPNKNMEFHGVMRFYFQEPGEKVTTKCVRVSSFATTRSVISALVTKFHPDMKMLTLPTYSIWEVHENGQERKLGLDERPLLAQLNWHNDDLEGRFLLRRDDVPPDVSKHFPKDESIILHRSQKRFSKREKKEVHRRQRSSDCDEDTRSIYAELPQNTFTRTISNPEIVMQKRREKKLENKLKEIVNGGSLKVYGVELFPDRPYVTLLLNANDTAAKIVAEALSKYGVEKENLNDYVLVEVVLSQDRANLSRSFTDLRSLNANVERYLRDNELPLSNINSSNCDNFVYFLRKRPSNDTVFGVIPDSINSQINSSFLEQRNTIKAHNNDNNRPYLVPVNSDGTENLNQKILIPDGVIEIGTQAAVQVLSANILPRHCAVYYVNGAIFLEPLSKDAHIEVNGMQVTSSVELTDNSFIYLGRTLLFRLSLGRQQQISKRANSCHSMQYLGLGKCNASPEYQHLQSSNNAKTLQDINSELIYANSSINSNFSAQMIKELPALLDVHDQLCEEKLLRYEFFESPLSRFGFRLTPAFTLYMVCRHRLSQFCVPVASVEKRLHAVYSFISAFADFCFDCIHLNASNCEVLVFWLANTSEFLHMLKADLELRQCEKIGLINRLLDLVEKTYEVFVECCCVTIRPALHALLKMDDDDQTATHEILTLLNEIIQLIRKSLLNSALTIQIFSQIFHFINMYIFNWLVTTNDGKSYLTRFFGIHMKERLQLISKWAERQGLEQAFECHIDRIQQTVDLLITPKKSDQIASLGATCYKLNSIQVRYLLENYIPELGAESPISFDLIDHVVYLAKGQADVMATQDSTSVQLEEVQKLQLPFLFPQDGYLVEVLRGVPSMLMSFTVALQEKGVARLILQNTSSWVCHMVGDDPLNCFNTENDSAAPPAASQNLQNYEASPHSFESNYRSTVANRNFTPLDNENGVVPLTAPPKSRYPANLPSFIDDTSLLEMITIFRKSNEGIGLSIVAGQGIGESLIGIYVKKVIDGTPAFRNGQLSMGDQLVSVNGQSLVGISQEEAAQKMSFAGTEIRFGVLKGAAKRNGLDSWLIGDLNNAQQPIFNGYNSMKTTPKSMTFSSNLNANACSPVLTNQHNRSLSTSELYSQTDTVSMTSENSGGFSCLKLPPTMQLPHYGLYTQQDNIQNQQHLSTANSRLPSHYKLGSRPMVVQPGRPSSSPVNMKRQGYNRSGHASPVSLSNYNANDSGYSVVTRPSTQNLNLQRSTSAIPFNGINAPTHQYGNRLVAEDTYQYSNQLQQHLNLRRENSSSSSAITDYSHLPLINSNFKTPIFIEKTSLHANLLTPSEAFNSSPSRSSHGSKAYFASNPSSSLDVDNSVVNGSNSMKRAGDASSPQVYTFNNSSNSTSPLPAPPSFFTHNHPTFANNYDNSLKSNTNDKYFPLHKTDQRPFLRKPATAEQIKPTNNNTQTLITNRFVQRQPQFMKNQIQPIISKHFPPSGRRSAPLFNSDCHMNTELGLLQTRAMTIDELSEQLNQLDSKKNITEAEKAYYQQLLMTLSSQQPNNSLNFQNMRQTHSASVMGIENPAMMAKNLPYLSEMESRLESKNRLKKVGTNSQSAIESMIEDVSKEANRLNSISLDSHDLIRSTSLGNTANISTNRLNGSPNSALALEDKLNGKKRVQFREDASPTNLWTSWKKLDSINELTEELSSATKNSNLSSEGEPNPPCIDENDSSMPNENEEPRTQIIGANEVYNDPRQRRLDQFQAKSLKPVVDGSNLGFRDKMKLFAEQLGEQLPKNRHNISSAQREIEIMDSTEKNGSES